MPLIIDIQNVEELIFYNKPLQKRLTDFQNTFDQWTLGKRVPQLGFLSQRAKLTFLESVQDEHLDIISEFLNEKVTTDPIDYHIGKNYTIPLEGLEEWLLNHKGFNNNFCLGRDRDKVYISFWR